MNILIIVVDALRQDHLGFNGYSRSTSPNIDKLAKEGACFTSSYTSLPRTDPSLMSILSGTYPHNHGLRLVHGNKINKSLGYLPEILKAHNYKTCFMSGCGVYNADLSGGFDYFDQISWKIKYKIRRNTLKLFNPANFLGPAEQYTDFAINWIKKIKGNKRRG